MTVETVVNKDIGLNPRISMKAAKKSIVTVDTLGMVSKVVQSFGAIGIKLEADEDTDEVNGFVSVDANTGITVGIYEAEDLPQDGRKTTFKKPTTVPTLATIDERITNAVDNL